MKDVTMPDTSRVMTRLFSELVDGANDPGGAFMLNSGDVGLLRSPRSDRATSRREDRKREPS